VFNILISRVVFLNVILTGIYFSKVQILFESPKLIQKPKFCLKIQILVKNPNLGEKIQILFKNPNFVQKSNFRLKI